MTRKAKLAKALREACRIARTCRDEGDWADVKGCRAMIRYERIWHRPSRPGYAWTGYYYLYIEDLKDTEVPLADGGVWVSDGTIGGWSSVDTVIDVGGAKILSLDADLSKPTDEQYVEAAVTKYQRDGEIEIDKDTVVSRSDDGAYVQAWVWIEIESLQSEAA
jgi:hypothetical protein